MSILRRSVMMLLVAAAVALLTVVVMWFEERLIYFPTRGGRVRGAGNDVWLTASDGVKLYAWHGELPHATKTLLYLHGNAGNLAGRSGLLTELLALGQNVFALDYRGYGQSQGEPSEAGLYRDAAAAYEYVAARTNPASIVLLGESLGGGPACELASTREVGGLILLSTFTNIPEMAALSFPLLPTRLLVRTQFDNLTKLRNVRAPKLIVHSRADEMIPFSMAERLFDAAAQPKQKLWLSRASHNDAFVTEREPLVAGLRAFLEHPR